MHLNAAATAEAGDAAAPATAGGTALETAVSIVRVERAGPRPDGSTGGDDKAIETMGTETIVAVLGGATSTTRGTAELATGRLAGGRVLPTSSIHR